MADTNVPTENISQLKSGIPTDGNRNKTSFPAPSNKLNKLPFPKLLILILAACLLFFGAYFGYTKYRTSGEPDETPAPKTGIANPASVYCKNQGGTLEIREGTGGQVGYCVFDDGSECEEWAFLNKVCHKGQSKNLTPAPEIPTDWKVYSAGSFQVNYPPDAKLNESEGSAPNISDWGPYQKEGTELYDGYSVNFEPRKNPNKNLSVFVDQLITNSKNQELTEIISGPDPFKINSYEGLTYTTAGLGTYKNIVLQNPQNPAEVLIISVMVSDPSSQGFQETVDQILSTFKFL